MKPFLIILLIGCTSGLYAQNKPQHIIGSAGNSVSNANAQLSWSIGEPITKTSTNGGIELAQGFHNKTLNITAMEELNALKVSIYPNPTADVAFIDLGDMHLVNASYSIIDAQGRLVQTEKINNPKLTISFKDLPAAAYILQVSANNQVKTFKVVKN